MVADGTNCARRFQQMNTFWYAYQDFSQEPSFGVYGEDGNPLYDLSC